MRNHSLLGALVPVSAAVVFALAGCDSSSSSGPRVPPYVLQEGCTFTLQVSEYDSTSTTIEKGNTMVSLTLSMGGYQVKVSDCRVVENPQNLPVLRG
ncbi:MAG: hypothetical protein LAT63_16195 [Marinobacter sp.]|nr:hypothetical protein [Marinobacter sp.]